MLQHEEIALNILTYDATSSCILEYPMSNYMHTTVQIAGPANEISRFLAAHIHKDNNREDVLDFIV